MQYINCRYTSRYHFLLNSQPVQLICDRMFSKLFHASEVDVYLCYFVSGDTNAIIWILKFLLYILIN